MFFCLPGRGNGGATVEKKVDTLFGGPSISLKGTFGDEDEMAYLAQSVKSFKCKATETALYPKVETCMLRAVQLCVVGFRGRQSEEAEGRESRALGQWRM